MHSKTVALIIYLEFILNKASIESASMQSCKLTEIKTSH